MSSGHVPAIEHYALWAVSYNRNMTRQPHHDWYLTDWISASDTTPARLRELTGWSKRKMSELINGQMRYNRDVINEAARALNIQPFELLMHPSDAAEIKSLRAIVHQQAVRLVAEDRSAWPGADDPAAPLTPARKIN